MTRCAFVYAHMKQKNKPILGAKSHAVIKISCLLWIMFISPY